MNRLTHIVFRRAVVTAILLVAGCASGEADDRTYKTLTGESLPDSQSARLVSADTIKVTSIDGQSVDESPLKEQRLSGSFRMTPGKHVIRVRFVRKHLESRRESSFDQVVTHNFVAGKAYTFGYVERDYGRARAIWRAVLLEYRPAEKKVVGQPLTVSQPLPEEEIDD